MSRWPFFQRHLLHFCTHLTISKHLKIAGSVTQCGTDLFYLNCFFFLLTAHGREEGGLWKFQIFFSDCCPFLMDPLEAHCYWLFFLCLTAWLTYEKLTPTPRSYAPPLIFHYLLREWGLHQNPGKTITSSLLLNEHLLQCLTEVLTAVITI